ncbi:hypothetical protein BH23GEM5_BH23GEM5_02600 [soil metagenome]
MRNQGWLYRHVLALIRRLFQPQNNAEGGALPVPPNRIPTVAPPKLAARGRRDFAFGCIRPQGDGFRGVVVMNSGEPFCSPSLRQADAGSAQQVLAKLLTS